MACSSKEVLELVPMRTRSLPPGRIELPTFHLLIGWSTTEL
uniref:Uncharacterized protein n=1 Tax=Peronospora matthiolae TaxID=2874970 RepID=A0AAV1VNX0_9STRA